MAECFKCRIPDKKTTLYTVVSKSGIVKACLKCISSEKMPIVDKKEISEEVINSSVDNSSVEKHDKGKMVYDRLSKLSGVKSKNMILREKEEQMRKQDNELRKLVEKGIQAKEEVMEKRNDLIDNFHWTIMRMRRSKKLTQKDLAKEIGESEALIKLAEEGKISVKNDKLVDKLEIYLHIKLRKQPKESLIGKVEVVEEKSEEKVGEEVDEDFNVENVNGRNITVSELKRIGEEEKRKEFNKEVKKFEDETRPLTKEEIDKILYGDR